MIYKGEALFKQVKRTYKPHLKLLEVAELESTNPLPHHKGKAAYVSEPGLYQLIFSSWLKLVDKTHLCYLMHCPVSHENFREE